MKASWSKRKLAFKHPAGTSRGIMNTRDIWYIFLSEGGKTGIGECAPLPGLSLDDLDFIESKLDEISTDPNLFIEDSSMLRLFPSIRCGLEMAHLDLKNGGGQTYFTTPLTSSQSPISINGLVWMGDPESMIRQIEQKIDDGWQCIKIKIGALDFDAEVDILKFIRTRFSRNDIELRVDANGAFTSSDALEKLNRLEAYDLHSIEQPIQAGQWELLSELCKSSPVPIALDEELIPLVDKTNRIEMLNIVKPQYLVLKPSLLGGFSECEQWIRLAEEREIGWWITSALESNIGLNAIVQWTSKIKPEGFQGLGTGQLFNNNIPSPLKVKSGKLWKDETPIWKDINTFICEWMSGNKDMVLQTSGSTGAPKKMSVKKEWMKNSASLTGQTFHLKKGDIALLCLPMKYIAGKMMVVRAMELGMDLKVVEPTSSPLKEIEDIIDFAAMVPLQLEKSLDLLKKVKVLIVGGGQVNQSLIKKLQSVSTRVYETYGMTETLSHIAIKPLNGPEKVDYFKALEGVFFEIDDRNCLVIQTSPLLSLRAEAPVGGGAWQSPLASESKEITSSQAPRDDKRGLRTSSVITNDIVELINETSFRWLGRFDNIINSGGVKIIPELLEEKLASVIQDRRFFIAGLPDKSLGNKIALVVEGERMNISFDSLEKYEKPKEIYFILKFIETETGKIHRINTLKISKIHQYTSS